jgi:hypothetical protein
MSAYTIPAVPEHVERELRRRALDERKDVNAVILESLERGLGLRSDVHTDLDFLIGSWENDPAFDEAVETFERVDEELWR